MDTEANIQIAEHLNQLLARSIPIEHYTSAAGMLACHTTQAQLAVATRLYHDHIKPILAANLFAAQREELVAAADERRKTDLFCVEYEPSSWHGIPVPWAFTRRLWDYCAIQINAAIDGDNAHRLAEYERYRLAVQQGVAVPPGA
jgi:hypothetical protein